MMGKFTEIWKCKMSECFTLYEPSKYFHEKFLDNFSSKIDDNFPFLVKKSNRLRILRHNVRSVFKENCFYERILCL